MLKSGLRRSLAYVGLFSFYVLPYVSSNVYMPGAFGSKPLYALAFVLAASLLATAADALSVRAPQSARRIAKYAFILLGFYVLLEGSRKILQILEISPFTRISNGLAAALILGVAALLLVRREASAALFRAAGLVLSPLALVLAFNAIAEAWRIPSPVSSKSNAALHGKEKIFVVIFDEFDYELAYSRRPADLSLPNLDRLAGSSVFFENAFPPSNSTLMSMPAIIDGKMVSNAKIDGNRLLLRFDRPEEYRLADDKAIFDQANSSIWSPAGTRLAKAASQGAGRQVYAQRYAEFGPGDELFHDARSAGRRVLLAGWHHPYCRLFPEIETCWQIEDEPHRTFLAWLQYLNDTQPGCIVLHLCFRGSRLALQVESAPKTVDDLGPVLDGHDLFFLHLPTPHMPCLRKAPQPGNPPAGCTYIDNLPVVDETVGRLVNLLRERGLYEGSWIVVSSDHHYRIKDDVDMTAARIQELAGMEKRLGTEAFVEIFLKEPRDYRVPLTVKAPNQQAGIRVKHPVNVVALRGILAAIYAKEVNKVGDVPRFAERIHFQRPVILGSGL